MRRNVPGDHVLCVVSRVVELVEDPSELLYYRRVLGVLHQSRRGGEVCDLEQLDGERDVLRARRRQDDGDALLVRILEVSADPKGPRNVFVSESSFHFKSTADRIHLKTKNAFNLKSVNHKFGNEVKIG